MRTLAELRVERAEIVKKMEALTEVKDYGPEQRTESAELKVQANELDVDIAMLEDVETRKVHLAKPAPTNGTPPVIELGAAPADKGWGSFEEQVGAILRASTSGGFVDERLLGAPPNPNASELRVPTGMGTTIGADGGFFLQTEYAADLLDPMFETGVLSSRVRQHTITNPAANEVTFNILDETDRGRGTRLGGMRLYTRAQAEAVTKSKPAFRKWSVRPEAVMGICYFTQEELDDVPGIAQRITSYFNNEAGYELDEWILKGDGASEPAGIVNNAAFISVTAETGQEAASLVSENFEKMYARMPARHRANAIWSHPADALPQLMSLRLDMGVSSVPLWIPGNSLTNAPNNTVLGKPMLELEQAESIGTANDIMFIDPTQYMLVRKGGVRTDLSIHVQFLYGEVILRLMFRLGGGSWWKSAITPANDGDTIGPFIGLGVRA